MILQLRAMIVISGLLLYLERAAKSRGWSMAELARRAEISRATFTNWRRHPETQPDSSTLYALAEALDVDLDELLTALNIETGTRDGTVADERFKMIVDAIPEGKQILEALARATPANRKAMVQYILWLDEHRHAP